jgi:hypothetical protein
VDGDTDTVPVQEDFKNVVKEHLEYIKLQQGAEAQMSNGYANGVANGHANGIVPTDTTLQDLEGDRVCP